MTKRGPFTPHEENVCIVMRNDGCDLQQIAQVLNRTFDSIRHKVALLRKEGRIDAVKRAAARQTWRKVTETKRRNEPVGWTVAETQALRNDRIACRQHLIDLKREYSAPDEILAFAVERYRKRHELLIPPGAERTPTIVRAEASYCGSPAATCAGY